MVTLESPIQNTPFRLQAVGSVIAVMDFVAPGSIPGLRTMRVVNKTNNEALQHAYNQYGETHGQ